MATSQFKYFWSSLPLSQILRTFKARLLASQVVESPKPSTLWGNRTSDLGDFLYHVRKGVVGHTNRKAKKHQ